MSNEIRDVGTRPTAGNSASSAAALRAAQVQSLRLPAGQGGGGGSKFAWFLCILLTLAVGWFYWRERQLVARFSRILAEGGTAASADELADGAEPGESSDDSPSRSAVPAANGDGNSTSPPAGPARAAAMGEIALESKGYVIPAHQILVSPQVGGRLLRLYVEEGLRVKKGDLLGEIESTEFEADAARATATLNLARSRLAELEAGNRPEEIDQARADLAEAEAQLVQLDAEYSRAKGLINSNVITKQDFEVIESRFQALQRRITRLKLAVKLAEDGPRVERIDSARAEVKQAEADLAKARWRLDNCRILAPISGTILKKNAEEGNIVNPIAFNGSFSLCDLADLSDLEVSLDIQERDVSRVFKGQQCRIRADAFPERVYTGVVSRLMPIADRAKGAVPVRVKLTVPAEEEGVYLKPEMGAIVAFLNPAAEAGKAAKKGGKS
jgi:multidrug resistance efflux pump